MLESPSRTSAIYNNMYKNAIKILQYTIFHIHNKIYGAKNKDEGMDRMNRNVLIV